MSENTMYESQQTAAKATLFSKASSFIQRCYQELGKEDEIGPRLEEIEREIDEWNHYVHTYEELEHGARMAWRNANRCVGRLFWHTLQVVDARDCETPREVHEACCQHIRWARNDGDIIPMITIFPPAIHGQEQVRIWNYELLRYAGYQTDDGVIGDPHECAFTAYCESRGWEGDRTDFDILPHVIQVGDDEPQLFPVPDDCIEEIPITHPEYDWFADLELQWYDIPIVSNMALEIGGLRYTAAPFNGWYLSTEIGARNFADTDRYDMLPDVAKRMGLDTSDDRTMWKDKAVVALNRAVVHSFDTAGVRIVDHHTVTDQFAQFERNEQAAGREITGDWSWLIPPVSPATTEVFHTTYDDEINTPNYFYQDDPWEDDHSWPEA